MTLVTYEEMRVKKLIAVVFLLTVACAPSQPTSVPPPTSSVVITVPGNGNNVIIVPGNGNVVNLNPSPSSSPGTGAGGDNDVVGFAIFCYGFGAVSPQVEPNHDKCELPNGYPNIAVTASPKNKAGIDVPNPGDITSQAVIDWNFSVSPSGAAVLAVFAGNRFNAQVQPATGDQRVDANFTLVATYKDPKGDIHVATKAGSIKK